MKALGTSIKLTVEGSNQFVYLQTWFFALVVFTCGVTQLDYLNRVSLEKSTFYMKFNLCIHGETVDHHYRNLWALVPHEGRLFT